ncbi:hypothetical protein DFH09DRAFT_1500198, partial [Mycena vulgaris]
MLPLSRTCALALGALYWRRTRPSSTMLLCGCAARTAPAHHEVHHLHRSTWRPRMPQLSVAVPSRDVRIGPQCRTPTLRVARCAPARRPRASPSIVDTALHLAARTPTARTPVRRPSCRAHPVPALHLPRSLPRLFLSFHHPLPPCRRGDKAREPSRAPATPFRARSPAYT